MGVKKLHLHRQFSCVVEGHDILKFWGQLGDIAYHLGNKAWPLHRNTPSELFISCIWGLYWLSANRCYGWRLRLEGRGLPREVAEAPCADQPTKLAPWRSPISEDQFKTVLQANFPTSKAHGGTSPKFRSNFPEGALDFLESASVREF